ncbi:hypothetical protein OJF2_45060 [Aquisphaera giovannonii]|uniref:Major Facilitator Superfamily protein n=1 Tax=Aquisphaera giovannonii TaxID=406548 RepID=A0A5B9W742_9BACT|nr:hypothetical protein OJF2_45060 [Aquisphaera giovannonii]
MTGCDAGIGMRAGAPAGGAQVPGAEPPPSIAWRRLRGGLRAVADVRDGEEGPLLRGMAFLFCVLAANYLVRPVRDEMGLAAGRAHLPALFLGTLAAMLVAAPMLSARLRRPGRPLLPAAVRATQFVLVASFAAFWWILPEGHRPSARAFFVWASVANLLAVSVAWGTLAGRFGNEPAHRLFGLIAAGGTLGAVAGSSLAGLLVARVGTVAPLLAAAVVLELGLMAARSLPRADLNLGEARSGRDSQDHPAGPPRGRSPYPMGLGLWTLLFTSSSAVIYMEQARIVDLAIGDAASRAAFFARVDLYVNLLGLLLQVAVAGRVLAALGAGAATAMLPAVTLAGVVLLYLRPGLATLQWFQVVRRGVDYAIARPGREVFCTVLGRDEMLRSKGLIDTAVYRAGDAAGAWAYGALAAMPALGPAAPLAIVPLSVGWIALSLALGRAMNRRLAADRDAPSPATEAPAESSP